MRKIDLHIHTFFSDGEDSLQSIYKRIRENKVSLFSICDHNYIAPEIIKITETTKRSDIIFLQGVEISCIDRISGESLHILGYSTNFDINLLNNSLRDIIDGYNRRAEKIIEKLNNQYNGFNLNIDELLCKKREAYISRNTLATELIKFFGKNHRHITMKEALKEVFIEEDDSWMPDSKEVIQSIYSAGGIAILAHPGKLVKKMDDFESLLKRLIKYGVVGLEAHYPKHDEEITRFLIHLSSIHDLIITAGSDWHGKNYTPDRIIGFEIEDYDFDRILESFHLPKRKIGNLRKVSNI